MQLNKVAACGGGAGGGRVGCFVLRLQCDSSAHARQKVRVAVDANGESVPRAGKQVSLLSQLASYPMGNGIQEGKWPFRPAAT